MQALKDAGQGFGIVQVFPRGDARQTLAAQQIAALVAGGLAWQAYIAPVATAWTATCVLALQDLAGAGYTASCVYLDCEATTVGSYGNAAQNVASGVAAILGAGFQAGIYAAESWWVSTIGNAPTYAALPLWWANYGGTWVPFAGWSTWAIHQTQGSVTIAGVTGIDANVAA